MVPRLGIVTSTQLLPHSAAIGGNQVPVAQSSLLFCGETAGFFSSGRGE